MFLNANSKFGLFLDEQINMVNQINDENSTQEIILKVTSQQKELYSKFLEKILANKKDYLHKKISHESEIFSLQKIIKLNKRHKNKYAVIRDEVLIKSYKLIDTQNLMIKEILQSLDNYKYVKFQINMGDIFAKNQIVIQKYNKEEYKKILNYDVQNKVIIQAQNSIKDFHALIEVNADILKYFSIFDKKIYTLNKYSQYNLIKPVLFINDIKLVHIINLGLVPFGF
ncbi:MAG: mechanosensitive ion channel protein, partial [Sulfurimonas sp.]